MWQLFAVQAELSDAEAVAVAARTGCTAEAALTFFRELQAAASRCLQRAQERVAEAAAAAAAAEGHANGNGKAAAAGGQHGEAEVQAALAAAAATRQAAAAKLRALLDPVGRGLRDASVTGTSAGDPADSGMCPGSEGVAEHLDLPPATLALPATPHAPTEACALPRPPHLQASLWRSWRPSAAASCAAARARPSWPAAG